MTLTEIKETIEKSIPNSTAYILDPMNDGQHLQAIVVSPVFQGMLLVKQHKMVMQPLKEAFAGAVHAMALKTFTPDKWNEAKHHFGLN